MKSINTIEDATSLHTFAILGYKESPYLEVLIESLQKQSVKAEIILCTSTPSDFLRNTAAKNNIPLYIGTHQSSLASDWTFAYNQAKTPLVTLAHQDDIYEPTYGEKVITHLLQEKDSLIAFTHAYELHGFLKKNSLLLKAKKFLLWAFLLKSVQRQKWLKQSPLIFGSAIMCPSVTYNKKNLGFFTFNPDFLCNCDWDTWLNFAKKEGSFIFINERLLNFRISETQHTSLYIQEGLRQKEDKILFEQIWPQFLVPALTWLYSLSYRNYK